MGVPFKMKEPFFTNTNACLEIIESERIGEVKWLIFNSHTIQFSYW